MNDVHVKKLSTRHRTIGLFQAGIIEKQKKIDSAGNRLLATLDRQCVRKMQKAKEKVEHQITEYLSKHQITEAGVIDASTALRTPVST